MDGLYLYGIVGFPPPLFQEIRGLGGAPVFLLPSRELAALVSPSPLSPWPIDETHLTLHETVVEEVMGSRPVLPVRFNTLLRTDAAVLAFLDERAQGFCSALERVAEKAEMGLRVLWEPPNEARASVDQGIGDRGPGTEYLYWRLGEERREARLRAAGERLIRELQSRLQPLAVESWLPRFPTDHQFFRFFNGFQLSTPGDKSVNKSLLFTGAYLVKQDRVDAFREGVAKAREALPRLSFLPTGPWPPYHFVNGASNEPQDPLSTRDLLSRI
jgi:hypothetical protein